MRRFSHHLISVWMVTALNLITISTLAFEDHSGTPESESNSVGTIEPTFRFTKDSNLYKEIMSLVDAVKNSNESLKAIDIRNFRIDETRGNHVPIDGLDYENARALDARKDMLEQLKKHRESIEKQKAKITPEDLRLFNQLDEDLKKVEAEFLTVEQVLSKLSKIEERIQNLTKPPQNASLIALEESISNFEALLKLLPSGRGKKTIDLSSDPKEKPKMAKEIDTLKKLLKDIEKESLELSADTKKQLALLSSRAKGLISDWDHLQKAQTEFLNQDRSSSDLALNELPSGALEAALLNFLPSVKTDSKDPASTAKLHEQIKDLRGDILTDIETRNGPLGANLDVAYLSALEKLKEAESKINQLNKSKSSITPSAALSAIGSAMFPTLSSVIPALTTVGTAINQGFKNPSKESSPETKSQSNEQKEESSPPNESKISRAGKDSPRPNSIFDKGQSESPTLFNERLPNISATSDRISTNPQGSIPKTSVQKDSGNHNNSIEANSATGNKNTDGQQTTPSFFQTPLDKSTKQSNDKLRKDTTSNDPQKPNANQNQASIQAQTNFSSPFSEKSPTQTFSLNSSNSLLAKSDSESTKLNSLNDISSQKENTAQSNSKASETGEKNGDQEVSLSSNEEGYSLRKKSKTKPDTNSNEAKRSEQNNYLTVSEPNSATFITTNNYNPISNPDTTIGNTVWNPRYPSSDSFFTLNEDGTFSRIALKKPSDPYTDPTETKLTFSTVQEDLDKISTEIKSSEPEVKLDTKEENSLWSKLSLKPESDSLTKLLEDLELNEDKSKSSEINKLLDSTDVRSKSDVNFTQLQNVFKREKQFKTALASNGTSQTTDSKNLFSKILSWFGF
ncbi:MAG: hypothetical protein FJ112_11260 [Deltaproteobacteria bacterium]|nr:hypothetical protein [Deltaproteobacteria bacterium]